MNEVFRVEQKYLIDQLEYRRYLNRFLAILTPDQHSKTEGYRIRSLYFDTLADQDYMDKRGGEEIRRKLRLRCYNLKSETVLLEMKQKQGSQQRKRSLSLSRKDAQRMMVGDYSPLLLLQSPFALECYTLMNERFYRPKVVVEYRRQAFVSLEGNTRVTFDTDIRSCEGSLDLFSHSLPLTPAVDPYLVVLEVKYNGFLSSYIQEMINTVNKSNLSVSKYCEGRMLLS